MQSLGVKGNLLMESASMVSVILTKVAVLVACI